MIRSIITNDEKDYRLITGDRIGKYFLQILTRTFLTLALLIGSVIFAFAQHIEISGHIENDLNEPLSNANIV